MSGRAFTTLAGDLAGQALTPATLADALDDLAGRARSMPDHTRATLQALAGHVRAEYEELAHRILTHEQVLSEIAQANPNACQLREDYGALINRAKNALADDNYRAADRFLGALDAIEAEL